MISDPCTGRPRTMNSVELTSYLDAARAAARRAAGILESWRSRFSVREKGRADLVTEADVASQQAVREELRGHERQLDWFRCFSLRAQSVRRTGSTALNIAYVAAGRFDGYWGFSNNPWDVAGAVVLVREAGGTVTAMDGGRYDHHAGECL